MDRNREIRARRLIAQRLAASGARPAAAGPVGVIEEMLALRARRFWPAVRALAQRAQCPEDAVMACIKRGEIVRTRTGWDTTIMVSAPDARWLAGTLVSAPASLAAIQRARTLGITAEEFAEARRVILADLKSRPFADPLRGAEAFAILAQSGIEPEAGRGMHIMLRLAADADVVCGATKREATFAHVDSLPGGQRDLSGDAALAELAEKFLASRGPASAADLAQWAGLSLPVAKHAVRRARGLVVYHDGATVEPGGDDQEIMAAWQTKVTRREITRALRRTMVVDSGDDYVLSYGDSSLVFGPSGHVDSWADEGLGQRVIAHGEVVEPAA